MAIIAYHQPITRSEIEEIRGISLSRGTIDILLELEDQTAWSPPHAWPALNLGDKRRLFDHFGLSSVSELPGLEDLKSAGLLRKGAVIGGLGETSLAADNEEGTIGEDELEEDLLARDVDFFDEDDPEFATDDKE